MKNIIEKVDALKSKFSFRQFISGYPCRLYLKGQIILFENETPEGVFIIESGKVRNYTINSDGNEQYISIHSKWEDIPIGFALGIDEVSHYFYEAYTNCRVRIIPRQDFKSHLLSDAHLMYQMYISNIKQLDAMLGRVYALEQPRASDKVALTLIYLADRLGTRPYLKSESQEVYVTQDEIAKLLGMTRETVSNELHKLRVDKAISYSRNRYILHVERIKRHMMD
ncbi:Crp/Fnr family transcriptional regulator [Candidatus Saccharibacteria bacterium]|nr:Crp/Fnr family transcriptional regulator [Candidatus Saccharibacteria bacterium]